MSVCPYFIWKEEKGKVIWRRPGIENFAKRTCSRHQGGEMSVGKLCGICLVIWTGCPLFSLQVWEVWMFWQVGEGQDRNRYWPSFNTAQWTQNTRAAINGLQHSWFQDNMTSRIKFKKHVCVWLISNKLLVLTVRYVFMWSLPKLCRKMESAV